MNIDFNNLPPIAWLTIIIISILISVLIYVAIYAVFNLLIKKNIKTKVLELSEVSPYIKEKYVAEGKDVIDNQSQVAKLMVKGGRLRLYQKGLNLFNFKTEQEKIIFELLTFRIADRLVYELKNDFTRNHILNKTDYELEQYARSKSKAYYCLIKEKLSIYTEKLPNYDLIKVIDEIPMDDIYGLFKDIYYAGRGIVGYKEKKDE